MDGRTRVMPQTLEPLAWALLAAGEGGALLIKPCQRY